MATKKPEKPAKAPRKHVRTKVVEPVRPGLTAEDHAEIHRKALENS